MEPLCRQYVLLRPPINYRLARRTIGFAKSFAPSRPQYAALSTHAPNSTMPKNSSTTSSSSVTQPLNAPLGPSPTRLDSTQSSSEIVAPSRYISSSVPAGAPLKGLNYFKGKEDPVAMEDRQYPEWLWSVLSIKEKPVGSKENSDPRIYARSAKTRRMANKRAKSRAMANPEAAERSVPLNEQSTDLPHGKADVAGRIEAVHNRDELTHVMRQKRRHEIKEANYLRSMR